ncbi:PREDICTED: lysozyme g-like [Branchiostoma belcheri]|uniref:Lysozyme g n=1 Tax=Branchiostoma belcheri TaxID=7741 RepID=A0A6P5AYZ1_BRABE|nr:PREDICTED: lysozyme g-like [Branchiostoma belcheri]
MIVDTTGASAETSSQDGLGYSGVAASHQMASTDHSRLNYYRQQIFEAANAKNMDPAIIAAIISRETRAGAALAADGTGDHGNGFGLMQVDYRYHTPVGGPYSTEHIKQGTQILIDTINCVQQRHPSWTAEMALKGGISGYNAGCGNVQSYAGMDVDTTGDDYANDVVARAQWLKAHGF